MSDSLPNEIWQIIITCLLNNHSTLINLQLVSRKMRNLVLDNFNHVTELKIIKKYSDKNKKIFDNKFKSKTFIIKFDGKNLNQKLSKFLLLVNNLLPNVKNVKLIWIASLINSN